MRWDDIEILRRIDRHQEQHGGGDLWHVNGMNLMEEIAGGLVAEQHRHSGLSRSCTNCATPAF